MAVVPAFGGADEIMNYNHSNGSYRAVLSCGVVYYVVQGVSNFIYCGLKPGVKNTVRWMTRILIQNQLVD